MSHINVLCIGDIVGRPGRDILSAHLNNLQSEFGIDFTIVNIENAASGFGVTPNVYRELDELRINAFTSGNHIYDKKALMPHFDDYQKLIRPYNFPPGNPGVGYRIFPFQDSYIAVINLIGRIFMNPSDCPFQAIQSLLPEIQEKTSFIFVDFHAETTSEKQSMGWFLDGKVSGVFGTHTHVQTADARILPQGTAYLSDLGMTGAYNSVLGMSIAPIVNKFLNQIPTRFEPADSSELLISGMCLTVNTQTGLSEKVQPFLRVYDQETKKQRS